MQNKTPTSIEDAAIDYHNSVYGIPKDWTPTDLTERQLANNIHVAFKDGANWQKEQDKILLQEAQEVINVFIGNTKSGEYRNYLTEVNIKLLAYLKDLSK